MSAKAAFLSRPVAVGEELPLRAVAAAAVAARDGRELVFVIEDDQIRTVPVKLGRRLGEMVELREGPGIGSRIAAAPLERLKDGVRVSIPKQ
jgi:multidrug efflux pump subunit AcrA (membrane-fusion protein)